MRYRENTVNTDCQNKRQQILDAAYVVFSKKGYHKATVDEIIALADTGKGTVYNYFVNKEQLFYTLIKEKSNPFHNNLQRILDSDEPALEKFETMIKAFLEFYVQNADLWRYMMHEVRGFGVDCSSNVTEEQRMRYQEGFTRTIGMLEKVILEGIEKGVVRPDCDASRVAHGLFSVIISFVFRKLVDDNVAETAHAIADFVLYGAAKR